MAKNKKTWKMEKGKWVEYQNGVKTGKTRRTPLPAIKGGAKAVTGLATRPFNQLKKTGNVIRKVGGNVLREALHIPSKKQKAEINEARKKREGKKSTSSKSTSSKSKLTWKNMKEAGLLDKKSGSTTTTKKSESTTGSKKSESTTGSKKKKMHPIEKRNREIHGDAKIDALKEKHRKWKAKRKAQTPLERRNEKLLKKGLKIPKSKATQGKNMPSNPEGMRQKGVGKTANDLTRHKTGSSITKKKKKKKVNHTGQPGGKYQFTTM